MSSPEMLTDPNPHAAEPSREAPAFIEAARMALTSARDALPLEQRPAFVARVALRLAEAGYVRTVSMDVTGGDAAAESVLAILAEMAKAQPDAPGCAIEAVDDPQAQPGTTNACEKRSQAYGERSRTCVGCRVIFAVNRCHAAAHKFCSAACRSRHHRRARKTPMPGAEVQP